MINKFYLYLNEPKTKIGWVHGFLACIGSAVIAYLTMALISSIINADYAFKIIPSMIGTPILLCIISFWLLFCKSYFEIIKKILYMMSLLLFMFFIKGFFYA
jgi:uncharacterized membrane protein YeaQ/YmgE (transglycosylase-associated protein family)